MLILKSPLMLQSISVFGTYSDALGEKIRGNYQTFGAEISGEDLLHMTMQEPDIYVGIENNGPFLMDTHIHADNQLKLELANQLVNRLMLYDSHEFTYQDEVFVAAVLQKIGITDVKEFMHQIRLHMEKNELTVSLLNRYFEDGMAAALTVREFLESNIYEKKELELIKNEYNSGCYLHNQVFRRLMTAECNNAVYSYQNPIQTKESAARWFHDMEWIVQADRIHLSQFRENMYYQENPVVFQEFSDYEIKPLSSDELTQRKVTARMGAAILENIVNKVNYSMQYAYGGAKTWKNYSSLFYKSAENVLARFRYFQNNNTIGITQIGQYEQHMNGLVKDELRLVQLMSLADRYADRAPEDDAPYDDLRTNIVLSVLENQTLQKQLTEQFLNRNRMIQWKNEYSEQETKDVKHRLYYIEEKEIYRDKQKRFEEAYRLLRWKRNDNYLSETDEKYHLVTAKDFWEEKQEQDMEIPVAGEKLILHESAMPAVSIEKAIDIELHDIENAAEQQQAMIKNENGIFEIIRSFADSETVSDVPLMENIGLLEQINNHNVYMKQILDSKAEEKETLKRIVVDREQARAAALRALDNPEQVLLEIYENGKAVETGVPKEIERILSITDENTRHFYEMLIGIDSEDSDRHIRQDNDKNHGKAPDWTNEDDSSVMPKYALPKDTVENVKNIFRQIYDSDTMVYNELPPDTLRENELIFNIDSNSTENYYKQMMPHTDATDNISRANDITADSKRFRQFRDKVYSLLNYIETNEREYKTYMHSVSNQVQETAQMEENVTRQELLRHRYADINIKEMMTLENMKTSYLNGITVEQDVENSLQLVHKTKEQMRQELVDEVLVSLEESGVLKKNVSETKEETLFTQKELLDVRNEIIRQSEEHIANMVERNMKTQVHSISDMVYLELERRLKNEQRRRGY